MALPRVFFDILADGAALGRVVFELRSDIVPKTAENFRALVWCSFFYNLIWNCN